MKIIQETGLSGKILYFSDNICMEFIKMPKFLLSFLILTFLISCGPPSTRPPGSDGPSTFVILVPENSSESRVRYLQASITTFTRDGIINRLDVQFSSGRAGERPSKRHPVFNTSPEQALRVARSLTTGQDSDAVYALAQQIARSTYCRTGPVSPNNGITRYSSPEAIQAIVNESTRLNRDSVPAGLQGDSIPAVWYRPNGGLTKWEVSLLCQTTNPYR